MDCYKKIVLLNSFEIIGVVRRALSKIDPRLVEHGDRVAYIATEICRHGKNRFEIDLEKLFVLCVLHDIGAYKTNEIDDMVRFETENTGDHSLYGYLFLKNTSHLSDYAEALLYHHTDYSEMLNIECSRADYAQMIYLADRVDILLHSQNPDLSVIRTMAGRKFHPDYVEALFQAESQQGLSQGVLSRRYEKKTQAMEASLEIKNNEIMEYLKLLVYAIDFRSPYTVTHTVDTTIISHEIGKLLGLEQRELQTLYIGAFLHDIGKIAIPHSIVEKPGRLTGEEVAVMKTHIPEGEQILRGVVSDEICDIALRHHEKLDGSGYWKGLTAQELTLPQRIVAVADILSALSQQRSYKAPFPKEKVLGILRRMKEAGAICPQVVEVVDENYDTIMKNTEKSHDPVKMLYSNLVQEYSDLSVERHKGRRS